MAGAGRLDYAYRSSVYGCECACRWHTRGKLNKKQYFFAGPSKGADVPAWRQAARAELGAALSTEYAAVLLDLVKAFERVSHQWLARQGAKHGYNLYILRASIAVYCLGKVVRVARCCAKVLRPMRGITAGAVFATIELRLLLIQWLDEATKLSPCVSLTLYVYDISVEAVASETVIMR